MEQRRAGGGKKSGWRQWWAPWRSAYIQSARRESARCIFCFGTLNPLGRRRRLVLYAGRDAAVMLNRYPYNNGHLLIAPRRHTADLERLLPAENTALHFLLTSSVR